MKLNIDLEVELWLDFFNRQPENRDFVVIAESEEDAIWFTTNFTQKLICNGGNEVIPVYGSLSSTLSEFISQVNLVMPVGYRLRVDPHALYDLLLNFETEPKNRYVVWSDVQKILKENERDFELIFELLIVAAYLNRNGKATIKEDGTRYQVNQRNIFVFIGLNSRDINRFLDRSYYIPSIDVNDVQEMKFDFNIIELTNQ